MSKNENDKKGQNTININWYPGHMAKTKRLIKEKLNLIDIVFEIIDARIPKSSKIEGIDDLLKNKPRLLIMTKKDLCDMSITKKHFEAYQKLGFYVLMVNLKNDKDYKEIITFANEILKQLQESRLNKGLKEKEIRALVIGVPNVGKSTLINKLSGRKATNVGNTPGVTKQLEWLKTNSNILLLDTPGILWPKLAEEETALNLASTGAIKNEVLPIDDVAVYIIEVLKKYYPDLLKTRYKLSTIPDDLMLVYESIGKNMGLLIRGGEVDYDRVSELIVNDIKNEHLKGITFDR